MRLRSLPLVVVGLMLVGCGNNPSAYLYPTADDEPKLMQVDLLEDLYDNKDNEKAEEERRKREEEARRRRARSGRSAGSTSARGPGATTTPTPPPPLSEEDEELSTT